MYKKLNKIVFLPFKSQNTFHNFTVYLNHCKMKILSKLRGTKLSNREQEVRAMVAEGFSTKQIAAKLAISEYTVANHRKSIIKKTGSLVKYEPVPQPVSIISLAAIYGARLTKREAEVRNLTTDGLSSKAVAAKLSISEGTVSKHRKNIVRKKGVTNIKALGRDNIE